MVRVLSPLRRIVTRQSGEFLVPATLKPKVDSDFSRMVVWYETLECGHTHAFSVLFPEQAAAQFGALRRRCHTCLNEQRALPRKKPCGSVELLNLGVKRISP